MCCQGRPANVRTETQKISRTTNSKVVVRLVLDDRIIPAVADHNTLQFDLLGAMLELCVLLLDIFVEHRSIMTTVTFRGEMEAFPRVLWESTHEALQSAIKVRRGVLCGIGGQGHVGIRIGTAGHASSVLRAGFIGQSDDVGSCSIDISGDGNAIRETSLGGLVDVQHVACIGPRVRVVVYGTIRGDAARSVLLEQADHGRRTRT